MKAGTPDLELVVVSKRFGEVLARDSTRLHLRPGTVHALLGENGAGKTDAIDHGIGMVQQHFSLAPALSAAENFALGNRGRFDISRETQRVARCAAALSLSIAPDVRLTQCRLGTASVDDANPRGGAPPATLGKQFGQDGTELDS